MECSGTEDGPLVSGRTLIALAGGRLGRGDARERAEARHLMRAILAPHLGPRPLGSRQLFNRITPPDPKSREESH